MSQKLSTITPTYHSFTKDQLLTHNDLNEVINYFGDQDRLARICLSGTGIVCGFKVSKETDEGGTDFVKLTQGSGLTTDGDLLHLLFDNGDGTVGVADSKNQPSLTKVIDFVKLTKFRLFEDSEANYPQFLDSIPSQIQLFELIPEAVNGSTIFTGDANELTFENRTVILYLDCYSNEPGACTSISCDSQGIEQVQQVRVLVVNDDDLQYLTNPDYLFNSRNVVDEFINLAEIEVPRIVLNQDNSNDLVVLASDYNTAVTSENIVDNLDDALSTIATRVGFDASIISTQLNSIFNATTAVPIRFQYRYDLLKDVVDSYNEIKNLFIEDFPLCCPDIFAFPKHLLLGKLGTETLSSEDNSNRHGFYPSPILTDKYNAREHLISILERIQLMLSNYIGGEADASAIKITPSKIRKPLGDRSIPFYYDPQYDGDSQSELVKIWDFKRSTLRQFNRILGYHQSNEGINSIVQNPLNYNIDSYNFFRIEGLHNQSYRDALEEINLQKEAYGLAFDTKTLGITIDETEEVDLNEYLCEFEDLSSLLEACIDEQECVLGQASFLLSAFSTATEGTNNNRAIAMGRSRSFLSPDFNLTSPANLQPIRDLAVQGNIFPTSPVIPVRGGSSGGFIQETSNDFLRAAVDEAPISRIQEFEYSKSIQSYAEIQTKERVLTNQFQQVKDILTAAATVEEEEEVDLSGFEYAVIRNLYMEDNGIGRIVFDAFIEAEGYQSGDTFAYMETEFDALTGAGGAAADWDADVKNVMLYLPGQVLASAYAISLLIPTGLTAINADSIENFNRELDKLCSYTRQYQALHRKVSKRGDTVFETGLNTDIFSLVELLNNRLADLCCVGEKLQSILDQVEERKLRILSGLKLSNFIQDHPGLEHKAGVQPGGTFVIVYALNDSGEGLVPNGRVIADFALPYLCCSDCAPINFIVPKERVSLSLPTSVHCLGSDPTGTSTYEFTVSPIDGVIATVGSIPGVSIPEFTDPTRPGNQLIIDNAAFDLDNVGIPIKFTVNEQHTEVFMIVRQTADVGISSNPIIDDQVATTKTTFTFTALDTQPNDVITWNFGDGTAIGFNSPISHTYKLPVSTNPTIVTLTVTPANGACPAIMTQSILFDTIQVSMGQNTFCLNDDPFPITITPAGANPTITGIGVTADGKSFDPALTAGETGPFKLYNDGIEFESVTVEQPAIAAITSLLSKTNQTITLTATTENSSSFEWSFFDKASGLQIEMDPTLDLTTSPLVINYNDFGAQGTRVTIRLTAQSETSACAEVSSSLNFTVPFIIQEDTVVSIRQKIFCITDPKYPLTVTPAGIIPDTAGVGITADKLFFDPALTSGRTGPFKLYHKGIEFASVQVQYPPTIQITSEQFPETKSLQVSIPESIKGNQHEWNFINAEDNSIFNELEAQFDRNAPSLNIPYEMVANLAGKRLIIRLTVQVSNEICKYSIAENIYRILDAGVLEQEVTVINKGDTAAGDETKF
ncbi:MAG: hypothetical protein ACJASQ_003022 [Crocinitomicaceae bacterium]|jgi:hypothetical protein